MIRILGGEPGNVPPAVAQRLTLVQARQRALERNWDLLAAKADLDLATAQRLVAKEIPNPSLSLTVSKISVDGAHGSGTELGNGILDRSHDTVAAVSQLIELGGKRSARKASAVAGESFARERFAEARRQLDLGVTRAYVDVLVAEESAAILADSVGALRREAELAELRVKAGDISTNDRVQIEISAERVSLDAVRASAELTNARVRLSTLMAEAAPGVRWELADTLQGLGERAAATPAGQRGLLVENRPDVRAAEAAVARADAELRLQKAQRVPDPTVSVQYEHEPPDQPHTVGIGVSLPLPLWNWNRGRIVAAEASKRQAQLAASKAASQAAAEVSIAEHDYESAVRRRDSYLNHLVPKSASVRETVTFAYRKGGASLLDLLSVQRNDNELRIAAAQANAEVIAARSALAAARGEPDPVSQIP